MTICSSRAALTGESCIDAHREVELAVDVARGKIVLCQVFDQHLLARLVVERRLQCRIDRRLNSHGGTGSGSADQGVERAALNVRLSGRNRRVRVDGDGLAGRSRLGAYGRRDRLRCSDEANIE